MACRLIVAVFLAVWAMPLAADAPEQQFVIDALQVLKGATLHRQKPTETPVAVIGGKGEAGAMVNLLGARALQSFPKLGVFAKAVDLPDTGDASKAIGDVVAVVVVQATNKALQALDAFATTHHVLTISKRPQDIGRVGLVILPSGIYRDDGILKEQQMTLDEQTLKKSTPSPTSDWESLYRRASILRLQQRSDTDWIEIAKFYQQAILVNDKEDRRWVPAGNGTITDPYVPHFRLGQALAMIGDCNGAREQLQRSDAAARKFVRDAAEIEQAISGCKAKSSYAAADVRQATINGK